ncbi:TetR/AcrR family transcriptional regulator [Xanthomonas massiliensis]|uniref:TetR/AcrR family transcriptional regulator n=1 Tax=Xanthomonas massiliensis TaxID=1720302 RepID=UPI000826A1A5|nr:TetR/AcrR family transcriptional regulator [Xanthomonas massiliensis]
MNDRKKTPARRPRRTQEDRSAQMRARLLEAAIDSLYRHGYSATTTTAVCEAAGVSRGAMLHHFPTRIDLMLYVVRAVYEDEVAQYRKALVDVPDRRERELMLPQLLWDVLGQPSGVAVLEIIQASRSDPELSARLRPVQIEIERDSFVQAGQMLGKTGVETNVARLMIWAVRGLSIARLLASRPEEVEGSIHLLREMLRLALDAGLVSSPDSEP